LTPSLHQEGTMTLQFGNCCAAPVRTGQPNSFHSLPLLFSPEGNRRLSRWSAAEDFRRFRSGTPSRHTLGARLRRFGLWMSQPFPPPLAGITGLRFVGRCAFSVFYSVAPNSAVTPDLLFFFPPSPGTANSASKERVVVCLIRQARPGIRL